jgi:dienelactone hydrolase
MSSKTCCPEGSHGYLAAEGTDVGAVKAHEGVEFYECGDSGATEALLIIPDVWGWNGGRTRRVADYLSQNLSQPTLCIVPKLLSPAFEGGTDGDALPPDFDMASRREEFTEYIGQYKFDKVILPKLKTLFAYISSKGITKVKIVGICWGFWVAAKLLNVKDLAGIVVACVAPHPSVTLEENIFAKDSVQVMQGITTPTLLLPTKNDPDSYREGGELLEALLEGDNTQSGYSDYKEVSHGFLVRGDTGDGTVKTHVDRAIKETIDFLNKY